jgi:radical SAM superfamily enzyme
VADALERLPEETVIMRLTTDTPGKRHKIPGSFLNKSAVYSLVQEELERRGSRQGALYLSFGD